MIQLAESAWLGARNEGASDQSCWWGQGVAERLNGMYAVAIWDTRSDTLFMIRDRMGIKPFYSETPDGVLFGSEPKAILANPLAKSVIDADGLRELLSFVKTPGHAV